MYRAPAPRKFDLGQDARRIERLRRSAENFRALYRDAASASARTFWARKYWGARAELFEALGVDKESVSEAVPEPPAEPS